MVPEFFQYKLDGQNHILLNDAHPYFDKFFWSPAYVDPTSKQFVYCSRTIVTNTCSRLSCDICSLWVWFDLDTTLWPWEKQQHNIQVNCIEGQTMADQNFLKCLKFEPVYLTDSSKEHWAQLRQWLFRVQLHIDIPYKKNCLIAKQASVLHYLCNISLF